MAPTFSASGGDQAQGEGRIAAPSGSPLPKRQAPERETVDPPSLLPPQLRSRQPTRKPWRRPARKKLTQRSVKPLCAQEEGGLPPPPALLPPQPSLEKEIEAVLSCDVVPTFVGKLPHPDSI
jgi:hypothetical protein